MDNGVHPGLAENATPVADEAVATPFYADEPPDLVSLEFSLPPEEASRLWRSPVLAPYRNGRVRAAAMHILWHDTPTGMLAAGGLALAEQRGQWRLERLTPEHCPDWLPATVPPVLVEGASPEALDCDLPSDLVAVAAFAGRRRTLALHEPEGDEASLTLLEGTLRGVARDLPAARVILTGTRRFAGELARTLGDHTILSVPRASMAAEAIALVSGKPATARRLGAPDVAVDATVGQALTTVIAHLADVILYWASRVPASPLDEGATAEPVHQMRVGIRRLRSAISVFKHAGGAALQDLAPRLKAVAARLGPARDWDVFLAGTGNAVGHAFAGDKRIASLLAAASRKREVAYGDLGDLLAGREWRRLEMDLALLPVLRPWDDEGDNEGDDEGAALMASSARDFAEKMLGKRLKHVLAPGEDVLQLDSAALHDIRKQGKRLRYAAEFFMPLFSHKAARKYLHRLADVQEAIGEVNDGAVAATLMAELGGGADRAFASGVVQGFIAAHRAKASGGVEHAWKRFYEQAPFWE